MKTLPNFDFGTKLKWNPAYIAPPGSYSKIDRVTDNGPFCKNCKHIIRRDVDTGQARMSHPCFCGKVVEVIGEVKKIDDKTVACEQFSASDSYKRKLERLG